MSSAPAVSSSASYPRVVPTSNSREQQQEELHRYHQRHQEHQRLQQPERSTPPKQVYAATTYSKSATRKSPRQELLQHHRREYSEDGGPGDALKQFDPVPMRRTGSFPVSQHSLSDRNSSGGSSSKQNIHSFDHHHQQQSQQSSKNSSNNNRRSSGGGGGQLNRSSSARPASRAAGSSNGSGALVPYGLGNAEFELASSSYSEELSSYSAQSAPTPPSKLTIEYNHDREQRREPSPISFNSSMLIKRDVSRDSSPDRSASQDSDKQYVRTTRRIVEELSRAQGTARRVAAVTSACDAFDHHDESRHNIELFHGSAQALARMLEQSRLSDDEIRMICSALEMVFRASPKAVSDAYKKAGGAFLTRLLRVLERCEQRGVQHGNVTILNITKILFYFSKSSDLRVAVCRHSDMPDFLVRVATTGSTLNPDCRALRMRTLANLASADKNKVMLCDNAAIVDSILRVAHMDGFDLCRQYAAVALQELSSSSHNHVSMAHHDQLLGILVKMALVEKSLMARDAVISALQTLAFTKKNRVRLCQFKDGVVLEALKRTLSVDPDDKIRRRAAGTLTNLACEETAELMGRHQGLLEALAIVSTKDYNSDVQARAALALTKIGSNIHAGMDCFNALLDALVVASLSKTSNSVTAVLRVKAREALNRQAMARHKGVLDTLADTCVSRAVGPSDRDNAMRAIMHLVNDDANKAELGSNSTLLHALVVGANMEEELDDESRESAIRALERLATDTTNRPIMARHPGLLQVVAKNVEREDKLQQQDKEVAAAENGYLAKPLLMTLLLAM